MTHRFFKFTILLLLLLIPLLAACSNTSVSVSHLPEYVQTAPQTVQVAYQFAIDNPELLEYQPCYCGCGAMGHQNNLDCYIQAVDEVGTIEFESHASGCGICVDITLDIKRLVAEGQSAYQIRQYIDATYSKFGPSTDTPMPQPDTNWNPI
jgi:uncharacterized protein with PCYCGC motif